MSLNDKGQAADPKDRLTEARAKLVMAQIVDGLIYLPQGLPWGQQSPPLPPARWGTLPVWRGKSADRLFSIRSTPPPHLSTAGVLFCGYVVSDCKNPGPD